MHKTSAWPLAWVYCGLVIYASLYPFTGWRDQGIAPWDFMWAHWPAYWTGFDVLSNATGYAPLGFLLCLGILRSGRSYFPVVNASVAAAALSFLMEAFQVYLPVRVPSNMDFMINVSGAWGGAVCALGLEKMGAIDRWSRFRTRWFVADARGGLVLLALWPAALLFPAPVPLGLGQIFERLEANLAEMLTETPFLEWLPVREVELQPLLPLGELVCVMLGALIPCLLGFCIIHATTRRFVFALFVLTCGVLASALSAALSFGPEHAWAWLNRPVAVGFGMAGVWAVFLLRAPPKVCAALMLLALGVALSLINQSPTSTYFEQTLQTWEQGRFIRFHGLAQWLGWLWPYAATLYALAQIWVRDSKN
jgi:VanZ family protein